MWIALWDFHGFFFFSSFLLFFFVPLCLCERIFFSSHLYPVRESSSLLIYTP